MHGIHGFSIETINYFSDNVGSGIETHLVTYPDNGR